MDLSPCPNEKDFQSHQEYIYALRRTSPEQRLKKAFELSEIEKQAEPRELSRQFSELDEKSIIWLYLKQLMERDNQELKRIFNEAD